MWCTLHDVQIRLFIRFIPCLLLLSTTRMCCSRYNQSLLTLSWCTHFIPYHDYHSHYSILRTNQSTQQRFIDCSTPHSYCTIHSCHILYIMYASSIHRWYITKPIYTFHLIIIDSFSSNILIDTHIYVSVLVSMYTAHDTYIHMTYIITSTAGWSNHDIIITSHLPPIDRLTLYLFALVKPIIQQSKLVCLFTRNWFTLWFARSEVDEEVWTGDWWL